MSTCTSVLRYSLATAQSTFGIVPRDAPDSIASSLRPGAQLVGQALACSKLQAN